MILEVCYDIMAFGHFLLGSHNFMVMALGLCVKWPLVFDAKVCCLTNTTKEKVVNMKVFFEWFPNSLTSVAYFKRASANVKYTRAKQSICL